jgi:hypothetical protein
MKRLILTLFIFSIAAAASGCAEQPSKLGSTPDEQRAHAEKAQGELSSEVKKLNKAPN